MSKTQYSILRSQTSDVTVCLLPTNSQSQMSQHWYHCLKSVNQSVTETQSTLDTEAYIVHRLIYKDTAAFRAQKIMSAIRQVQRCMKSYSGLKLSSFLANLVHSWSQCVADGSFLPSRDCVSHLLVELYRASVVLSRCADYCLGVYRCVQDNLRLQHFVPNMILYAGTVARIWCVSLALLRDLVSCYNSLVLEKQQYPLRDSEVSSSNEVVLTENISDLLPAYTLGTDDKGAGLWNVWQQFQSSDESECMATESSVKLNVATKKDRVNTEDVGKIISRPADNRIQQQDRPVKKKTEKFSRKQSSDHRNVNIADESETQRNSSGGEDVLDFAVDKASQPKQVKEKCLKLPASLQGFSKSVYTDPKVVKRFLKSMQQSPCKVKVKGYKVQLEFGKKVCAKLSQEVCLQRDQLIEQGSEEKTKVLKCAVKRLEKRLMKAVLSATDKPCSSGTEGLTVENIGRENQHSSELKAIECNSDLESGCGKDGGSIKSKNIECHVANESNIVGCTPGLIDECRETDHRKKQSLKSSKRKNCKDKASKYPKSEVDIKQKKQSAKMETGKSRVGKTVQVKREGKCNKQQVYGKIKTKRKLLKKDKLARQKTHSKANFKRKI